MLHDSRALGAMEQPAVFEDRFQSVILENHKRLSGCVNWRRGAPESAVTSRYCFALVAVGVSACVSNGTTDDS